MNLVQRFDDPRPKNSKVTGQTHRNLQTDGQRHTIICPVEDGHIKRYTRNSWSHWIRKYRSLCPNFTCDVMWPSCQLCISTLVTVGLLR